jgi:hypothetical protein
MAMPVGSTGKNRSVLDNLPGLDAVGHGVRNRPLTEAAEEEQQVVDNEVPGASRRLTDSGQEADGANREHNSAPHIA